LKKLGRKQEVENFKQKTFQQKISNNLVTVEVGKQAPCYNPTGFTATKQIMQHALCFVFLKKNPFFFVFSFFFFFFFLREELSSLLSLLQLSSDSVALSLVFSVS